MKFIRDLIGKKRGDERSDASPSRTAGGSFDDSVAVRRAGRGEPPAVTDILTNINSKVNHEPPVAAAPAAPAHARPTRTRVIEPQVAKTEEPKSVNIWDMDDDAPSSELPSKAPELPTRAPAAPAPAATASAAASRSPARSRRTKTRLIGFEKSDGDVVDLFNDAQKPSAPAVAAAPRAKFPVGWIVVAEGPGRGESFALKAGMSQIGRGEDQAVQLDFGDNSISRTNHAAIVYDPEGHEFFLGHGGKSNIVRLNNKPLISNEMLKSGDVIRIGETVLRFVALCDKSFNWAGSANGEDEDVAIA